MGLNVNKHYLTVEQIKNGWRVEQDNFYNTARLIHNNTIEGYFGIAVKISTIQKAIEERQGMR